MTSPLEGFMSDIRATRVSLVKNPANRRQFLVTKSEDNNTMDEIIQIITDSEGADEKSLVEALKGKDQPTVNAALSVYRTLSAFRDSLGEGELASIAKSLGYEAQPAQADDASDDDDAGADVKAEKSADDKKADDGNVANDANAAMNEVLETLRGEVEALKSEKRRADLRVMVSGIQVGKTEDELVEMLSKIDAAGQDVTPVVETLKAASTIADRSLFSEVGSNGHGDAGNDAFQNVEKAVQEIAKNEGVSVTKAWGLLGEQRPELLTEYYK